MRFDLTPGGRLRLRAQLCSWPPLLWAVAFVLDGFGAPVYAEALAGSAPEVSASILTFFAANAVFMSRPGLLIWVAGGLGMAMAGVLLLGRRTRTYWRSAVSVTGILLGAWPLAAAVAGKYTNGVR